MGVKLGPFTLKEECRLRVFENWEMRRIFGPKSDSHSDSRLEKTAS
jgi:hypothetical protein